MKRIILLITIIFLITGCYDNIEINELAIISGIGIDYKDGNYYVTYEIINDNKSDNDKQSYTVNSYGKTISEAFANTNYLVNKKSYFAHLKLVLIDEEIIKYHFKDITDYLLRDPSIRNEFSIVVCKDIETEEIFKIDNINSVITNQIIDIIDKDKYNYNVLKVDNEFDNVISNINSNKINVILNTVTLKDNKISLSNSIVLDKFKFKEYLSKEYSTIYNIFTKNTGIIFNKIFDNKNVSLYINKANNKVEFKNNKIIINLKLEGTILENNYNFNLKEEKTYNYLNKEFKDLIYNKLNKYINYLQVNNIDILGLQNNYYKKYKNDLNNWNNQEIIFNINLKINKKGVIFEART